MARAHWLRLRWVEDLPVLVKLSRHANPEVRFWAASKVVSPADAAERVREAMDDPDRRVRAEATRALLRSGLWRITKGGANRLRFGRHRRSTEGGFTALGQVIAGMEVLERLDLGDAVIKARVR